ncbi:hypothetical protein GCM10007100_35780 [Roseibacillus persicicus]|uniref:RNA polymerase sigma-70 region 2 domain-containing protein n=1 Tax=Roseibacillus persicicus TaxID=454148 RepID=A0A918TX40_9BACT|nr:hypothetical protein GCM10007100_35780 [Roseibacillus persicicus]
MGSDFDKFHLNLLEVNDNPTSSQAPGAFPATRWTLVREAATSDPAALTELCKDYWFPLYCYARRLRDNQADAEDLTQSFFAHLLSKDGLQKAEQDRGKLRSFLIRSLQNFAIDEWRHAKRFKRGGFAQIVSIDAQEAEERYLSEPVEKLTPEVAFDRAWASQLLEDVLNKLSQSYHQAGKGPIFEKLREQLVPGGTQQPYALAAAELGMSEPAVRIAAFKLRNRYRDLLKQTIAQTVSNETEVEEELAHLRAAFVN